LRGLERPMAIESVISEPWGDDMVGAYVLVQSEAGRAGQVTEDLRKIPDVISVETVTGPYDLVVRIQADHVDLLGKVVVGRIHAVESITRTLTCPIVSL